MESTRRRTRLRAWPLSLRLPASERGDARRDADDEIEGKKSELSCPALGALHVPENGPWRYVSSPSQKSNASV